MDCSTRVFDFNVFDKSVLTDQHDTKSKFMIQMYGIDKERNTYSIFVDNFKPFFYVKIPDYSNNDKNKKFSTTRFLETLHNEIEEKSPNKSYRDDISKCKLVSRHKLYGFDCNKLHDFVLLEFDNTYAFNKFKNLWFTYNKGESSLNPNGFMYDGLSTYIYESNIPPLLRFFHIQEISPSGWIQIKNARKINDKSKKSRCMFEFHVNHLNVTPLNHCEDRVPYKICSFDIEASSSHGDFPLPVKSYKKLAINIFDSMPNDYKYEELDDILKNMILTAFGFSNNQPFKNIDIVYPIYTIEKDQVLEKFDKWINKKIKKTSQDMNSIKQVQSIESAFEKMTTEEEIDDSIFQNKFRKQKSSSINNVKDLFWNRDVDIDRSEIIQTLTNSLDLVFPKLQGDKVTFIGSTFMNFGDKQPYYNNCIVLNSCDNLDNCDIVECKTEKEVLLEWKNLIIKEDPDIIIGYNIFGFDYQFLFNRSLETGCVHEFLQLSRNKNEMCGTRDRDTNAFKIEHSSIQIASGQHDLNYVKMNGRLQIDMYNYFRREENLTSYKLDYVAGHFIGDFVNTTHNHDNITTIKTSNLTGLLNDSFIHFEEIGHSVEYYKAGEKFKVFNIDHHNKSFQISHITEFDTSKKTRWCLAKDDVSPKDIFRLSNGSSADRCLIAKYCIQDCNLVHYLFNKVDVLTGFIEMSAICSVPITFLVLRGQGIKLTSYIAKKCREKNTLMPVIQKSYLDDGYEGAIVLPPKCSLYMDNPVACVDYSSLYPSCMISENLSHDSKVWTKEYNLKDELIQECGERDQNGIYIYDNLPQYTYVDVKYDTYKYFRKTPSAAAEKIKVGTKVCRYAQFPDDKKAIMPSILQELLKARKSTRKLIPQQTDEFMKNVLDKRQLGYKLTANSLYGQCGAKTSTFYEKDIAACTTATGRLLLTYGKSIIEKCYGNNIRNTKSGAVLTKAEYIYGDSIVKYTPVYVRHNGNFHITTVENIASKYGKNTWNICKEEGKQEKEYCEIENLETWSDGGWTKLQRVIRHKLAPNKKIMRILTHTGLVDVTDDHSLVNKQGKEIKPKDVNIGTELLHRKIELDEFLEHEDEITEDEAEIMGMFFGDGSCGNYTCPSGKKSSWTINNSSRELILKYLSLCKKVYTSYEWVEMDTIKSSGVYKISPRTNKYGDIVKIVEKYRSLLYCDNSKIIPECILNGSIKIREAFFRGLYDADGDKDKNGYVRVDQKSQLSTACIYWLGQSIGYNASINTRKDKKDIYRVTFTNGKQRKNPLAVKKICDVDYNDYVYDFTTINHHFAAGVGNMIVHNTDSVFFTFNLQTPEGKPIRGKEALEITIELAQEAGHLASKFLKGPHDLEYEKTFMPFCLLSKKRYVGMLYETDVNKCKRKEMGIVLKRRDNAPIVKDVYGGIIDILMKEQNIEKAMQFLNSSLQAIVDEKYSMDKLIITKSLRSNYKNPQSIAHKVLADRIGEREPGNKPSAGDRIPFVYIHNGNKKVLQGEKIETPTYIVNNKLRIDYTFYITNQIMKPVQQLFALVLEDIWTMKGKLAKKSSFKRDVNKIIKNTDESKIDEKIEKLRNSEIKKMLFDPFIRDSTNESNGNQSITNFFLKK